MKAYVIQMTGHTSHPGLDLEGSSRQDNFCSGDFFGMVLAYPILNNEHVQEVRQALGAKS